MAWTNTCPHCGVYPLDLHKPDCRALKPWEEQALGYPKPEPSLIEHLIHQGRAEPTR
jgi:hypothetical protein